MKLRFLGTGDAFGSGGRFNTRFYVEHSHGAFLVDCGASSLIPMRKFGIDPNSIQAVFITHLHGDHFGGPLGATGLVLPEFRRLAGVCLIALLIGMFIANVNAAQKGWIRQVSPSRMQKYGWRNSGQCDRGVRFTISRQIRTVAFDLGI
jgi:metal-dependent hydrolase (beta-lactamase superfamily II)